MRTQRMPCRLWRPILEHLTVLRDAVEFVQHLKVPNLALSQDAVTVKSVLVMIECRRIPPMLEASCRSISIQFGGLSPAFQWVRMLRSTAYSGMWIRS